MEIGNSVRTGRCGREESGATYGTLLSNQVADYVEPELCDGLQPRRVNTSTSSTNTAEREGSVDQASTQELCGYCGNYKTSLRHTIRCEEIVVSAPIGARLNRSFTPRERYLNTFKELIDDMYALTQRKNADYAGEEDPYKNFRDFGTTGFLVRMSDKWSRIRNLLGSGKTPAVKDEKVEDTLLDLATYSILLLCWLRSEGGQQ